VRRRKKSVAGRKKANLDGCHGRVESNRKEDEMCVRKKQEQTLLSSQRGNLAKICKDAVAKLVGKEPVRTLVGSHFQSAPLAEKTKTFL
jgi:hypothetical protein